MNVRHLLKFVNLEDNHRLLFADGNCEIRGVYGPLTKFSHNSKKFPKVQLVYHVYNGILKLSNIINNDEIIKEQLHLYDPLSITKNVMTDTIFIKEWLNKLIKSNKIKKSSTKLTGYIFEDVITIEFEIKKIDKDNAAIFIIFNMSEEDFIKEIGDITTEQLEEMILKYI